MFSDIIAYKKWRSVECWDYGMGST